MSTRQATVDGRSYAVTPPREAALRAMARIHPTGAHVSNETSIDRGYVHWKIANWLHQQGLAIPSGFEVVALSARGCALARELDIALPETVG